jgi:L-fuculose-phosphate aldolase
MGPPKGTAERTAMSPVKPKLVEADASPQHAVKAKLVDAIRMLERADIIDHNGHCSARRDATTFHINSGASVRGALTVDDIVSVDLDGNLVEGTAKPPLEFHIHSEIYRARPDVNCVMHTHPKWSTFLTMTGHKYKAVYAQGVLLGDIPVMDSPLSVNTKPMGEKLAATLGNKPAALLKAHGVVVVGKDILECFALAAYVEENAYRQYMAMQIGDPYVFSDAEQEACRTKLWAPNLFQKTWDHYYSKLT